MFKKGLRVWFRLLPAKCVQCGKSSGGSFKPFERHLLRRTQIDTVKFPMTPAVGTPVPVPPLVARLYSAEGKGAERTAHAEAHGRLQPGIPGGGSHPQLVALSISLVAQHLAFDESRRLVLVAHTHL